MDLLRRMAEETINRAIKAGILENRKCVTRTFSFYNNDTVLKSERLKIYGNKAAEIEKLINDHAFPRATDRQKTTIYQG